MTDYPVQVRRASDRQPIFGVLLTDLQASHFIDAEQAWYELHESLE